MTKMMNRGAWRGLAAGTAMLLLAAAGCGRERAAPAPAAQKPAATVPTPASGAVPAKGTPIGGEGGPDGTSDNGLKPALGEVFFRSREAGFSALFPAGCPKISTRAYPRGTGVTPPELVQCYCDLTGRPNEGVMVAVYLALRDELGGPPNPRNVTKLIEELTNKFHLRVMRQGPVARPDYEGVRAFCREAGGQGEMWVQGMLAGDRVFIMTAWRRSSAGLTGAQAARFFDSFRLEK